MRVNRRVATVLHDDLDESVDVDRLREISVETRRRKPLAVSLHRLGGHGQHRDRRATFVGPQPAQRFDGYLAKPVDVDGLIEIVRQHCG